MKTYDEVEVLLHAFLTTALHGGECSASRPGRFTPMAKSPRCPLDQQLNHGDDKALNVILYFEIRQKHDRSVSRCKCKV